VETRCGEFAAREPGIAAVERAPELDAAALLDGPGRELTLVAINLRPVGEIAADLVLGGGPWRPARARRVDGPSFMARSTEEPPLAAALREAAVPAARKAWSFDGLRGETVGVP